MVLTNILNDIQHADRVESWYNRADERLVFVCGKLGLLASDIKVDSNGFATSTVIQEYLKLLIEFYALDDMQLGGNSNDISQDKYKDLLPQRSAYIEMMEASITKDVVIDTIPLTATMVAPTFQLLRG